MWRRAGKFEGRSVVSIRLLAIIRFKTLSALRRRKDGDEDPPTIRKWRCKEGYQSSVAQVPDGAFARASGDSSILSTTTRNPWKMWLKSSAYRKTP